MNLISNDIKHNELMDKKFTCDAEDFSPHLLWDDIPEGTKSFAISCIDPDTDIGSISHWYVYNIPVDVKEIPQAGPIPGIELENDFYTLGYEGPCPESGTHRYIFTIYALDLEKMEEVTNHNFKKLIRMHALASAELIGLYEREFDIKNLMKRSCH